MTLGTTYPVSPSRESILRQERRMALVSVDLSLFADFVRTGIPDTITSAGLPDDAIFLSAAANNQTQCADFIYLHESFKPVPEGAMPTSLPSLPVMFTRQSASAESASTTG